MFTHSNKLVSDRLGEDYVMGKLNYEQMSKLNANVTRVQLAEDIDHFSTPAAAEKLYVKWVAERFREVKSSDAK